MFDENNGMTPETNAELNQHGANYAQEVEQIAPAPEQIQRESKGDQNWRLMRDRAQAAETRLQEMERIMSQNMNQNQPSQKIQLVEDDDDIDISDDSYVEGKQYKRQLRAVKKELKETRQQFQEIAQRTALEQAEFKLKTQFTDFDTVVTRDNLEKLALVKPSLYRSILANKDSYDQGYTAYEMIRASGLVDDNYNSQDRRIEENRSKPRAAANVAPQGSETPLARAGDYDRRVLTEARKTEILKRVEEAKRNRV